jgi:membrane associated rhomboid family serine protease
MFSFLNNIPQVTRNILILNVLLFLITEIMVRQGVDMYHLLGAHYFNSPLFQPYQLISHMFMHGDFFHLFFNMFALVMFGGFLERLWGAKRFFVFYFASAIGALALYNIIGVIEIMNLKDAMLANGFTPENLITIKQDMIADQRHLYFVDGETIPMVSLHQAYYELGAATMVGASGAIFGILAAFAILFPNTQLMLLFPPIPIKAKYLIGGYFVYELISVFYQQTGDNVAHLAHVGGAVVGAILVLIWRRNRTRFY